jgi:KUP system potassium uptake protein
MSSRSSPPGSAKKHGLASLTLGALGVVYGDIGTSPLYAVRECFHGPHAMAPTRENVLGVLSLIVWSLLIVISTKYLAFVLRADNRGEGGVLVLMSLARGERLGAKSQLALGVLGLIGAAFLYGDGMITPAITTLSAMEGLGLVTTAFDPYVLPLTIAVLVMLFAVQRRGTGGIGAIFGPVMIVWFAVLGILGARQIAAAPGVLAAVNPLAALRFAAGHGWASFLTLGSVFLVVTGGESLYADLGHFGRRPIRLAWFLVALPGLLLNYFGQASLLLERPEAAHNPFFLLSPSWALVPLVVLATAAAIIASQAVISGAFSLTRAAVQLGYIPRVEIIHTSKEEIGQIYTPGVNWALMIATIALVLTFRSSTNLAAAYGIAVASTMIITSIFLFVVASRVWRWPLWVVLPVCGLFLLIDVAFFGANIIKLPQGGWMPVLVAAVIFLVMMTWKRGRELLGERLASTSIPVGALVADSGRRHLARVAGTAIFLSSDARSAPIALLHNVKHNRVLHEKNVFLTVQTEEVPHVPREQRVKIEELGNGFWRVIARYGFMEDPHLPRALRQASEQGLDIDPQRATYFLSRNTLLASKRPGMALWRERLFVYLSRNASRPTQFYRIPPNRVIELGMQVEL